MLKVIGAGFGRTGTTSTAEALRILGFGPCHEMQELFAHPETIPLWRRKAAGEPVSWDELLGGYVSTVDWPSAFYWRELADAYPQAKVLLTVRDPQSWYDSVRNTIYHVRYRAEGMPPEVRARFDARPELWGQAKLADELVWERTFGGRFTDREHAIAVYQAHNADVQASVPAGRLLVFDVGQGWEPLCEFLEVDVPDVPFPRLNSSQDFRAAKVGRA